MKTRLSLIFLMLFFLSTLCSPNTFAQNYTQLDLPEGAKARLGKGAISGNIAYSPDGTRFAVSSRIGIWLYDTTTYQEVALIGEQTLRMAFSPDSRTIASVNRLSRKEIHLWDVETGTHQHTLEGHTGDIISIVFSPDGRTIATAGGTFDETIRLWDVETGTHQHTLEGHTDDVTTVVFSPDGTTLASASEAWGRDADTAIYLWDVATGTERQTLIGHTSSVNSVAFSPDGRTIASGSDDETIRLWDVETGTHKKTIEVGDDVDSVGFSRAGTTITSSGFFGIRLWDVATSTEKKVLEGRSIGRLDGVVFSPDGRTIAGGNRETGVIRLWDAETGEHKQTLLNPPLSPYAGYTGYVESVAFSPDSRTIAISNSYNAVRLWDVETGEHKKMLTGYTWAVESVAFSPDGRTIAGGSSEADVIRLWDAAAGTHKRVLIGHTDSVNSVAFSPDGHTIASGSSDKTIRLWDVATGTEQKTLIGHTDQVNSVVFSPDGNTIVSASGGWDDNVDTTIRLWDVATGTEQKTLIGHTDQVNSVVFSPDGNTIASSSSNDIRLWNAKAGTLKKTLPMGAYSVVFSPDGRKIASGSGHDIRLWDAETGAHKYTIGNGSGFISFSPDGNIIATGSRSVAGTGNVDVDLWDAKTGEHLHTFRRHTHAVNFRGLTDGVKSVVFGPDGHTIASSSWDGTILLWDFILIPTPPEREEMAGDVNGDGGVNIQDLVLVAANLGKAGTNAADVNGDGIVDIRDLVKVAGALGNAAAPSLHPQTLAMIRAADVRLWLSQAQDLYLTDATSQRGVLFLEQLLAALTPKETTLLANYPNPFNPETWIPYQLAKPSDVTLTIYAVNGQVVRRLELGYQPIGMYQTRSRAAYWDGRNAFGEPVASGVYFYTLSTESTRDSVTAGDFTATRKMLIRK